MDEYEVLKLSNQICFPLYAASREVIKRYRPFLENLGLTYTQYITMMVIWEKKSINVKELGDILFLDSGTLSPVLKSLESKGYITRKRCCDDERVLIVSITGDGEALRDEALNIPDGIAGCIRLDPGEADELYRLLYKLLGSPRPFSP